MAGPPPGPRGRVRSHMPEPGKATPAGVGTAAARVLSPPYNKPRHSASSGRPWNTVLWRLSAFLLQRNQAWSDSRPRHFSTHSPCPPGADGKRSAQAAHHVKTDCGGIMLRAFAIPRRFFLRAATLACALLLPTAPSMLLAADPAAVQTVDGSIAAPLRFALDATYASWPDRKSVV